MRRRRLVALAGLAGLLLLVAVAAQGASDIAGVDKVGWWTKRPGAQPLSGPTSFEVASGPDGDESVAALRILIFGSVTKATLSMSEVANMGTAAISVPKLQVCRTDTPWVLTTNPGAFADAPKPSCGGGSAPLTRDTTGNWSGDVTSMLAGNRSEISLMVVPTPDTTLPVPPTFIVDIATSRVTTEGTPDLSPSASPPTTQAVVTVPARGASPPPPAPATITPSTSVAAPAPTTTAPASVVPPRLGGNRVASTKKRNDWGKLFVLVPLSAIAAFGWVFGRKYATERGTLASAR